MLLCGPANLDSLFGSLSRIVVFLAVLFSLPVIRMVIKKLIPYDTSLLGLKPCRETSPLLDPARKDG